MECVDAYVDALHAILKDASIVHGQHSPQSVPDVRCVAAKQRKGLVLIDPCYELEGEEERARDLFQSILMQWPTATIVLWFPIKASGRITECTVRTGQDAARSGAETWMSTLGIMPFHGSGAPSKGLLSSGLLIARPPSEAMDILVDVYHQLTGLVSGMGGLQRLGGNDNDFSLLTHHSPCTNPTNFG